MRRGSGFTLVEILVVLAIVGILASLTYPSYAGYIARTRRIEGQIALLDIIQQQERYYSQHNTYVTFSSDSTETHEKRFKWWSGGAARGSAYELRGEACPGRAITECVVVKAIPGTGKVDDKFRDAACETLSLNSAGERGASGPHGRCWP
jgi:type IV pilus assembly protein PilE